MKTNSLPLLAFLAVLLSALWVYAQDDSEPQTQSTCKWSIALESPGNVSSNVSYGSIGGYLLDECTGALYRIDRDWDGARTAFVPLDERNSE